MTSCLIIAAIVTCTNLPPKITPEEAVKVLTSQSQPFTYASPSRVPYGQPETAAPVPASARPWPIGPLPPTQPLAPPFRVTTRVTRWGVDTWFNGKRVR